MSVKRKIVCAVFTLFTIATLIFIFSNSIKPAEQSKAQSDTVTDIIQDVVNTVIPQNPPTVTGGTVRKFAHLTEFAMLGFFSLLTYFAYTDKKAFLFVVPVFNLIIAVADEFLQKLSEGRGTELTDMLIDIGGATIGILVAVGVYFLFKKIYLNRRI